MRIGFIGMVNSTIQERLPRSRLADSKFDLAESSVRKQVALLRSEAHWRRLEVALALENDFGRPNLQWGLQTVSDLVLPIGLIGRAEGSPVTYRLRNDATYMLPARRDSPRDLALRYNMVHEIVVPLIDELSLSSAADLYFFQGKVAGTRRPGVSVLLRVGLTYDRLWKPRYQPFL